MSRITQKGATGPLNLFQQAYGSNPTSSNNTTAGTGFSDSSFSTYIGQKFDTSDGRELVLVSNGATALVAGVLVQSEAEVTAHQKLAMTVPATYPATAGLFQILVTYGSTVLNANKFAAGYAIVASGTGIGQMLKISTHQPAANAATFVVNLEDAIQTTLDATSEISLLQNPYANVIISPATTATGRPVGVTLSALAASTAPTFNATSGALTAAGVAQYGLIVTHGPVSCLIDSTVTAVGYPLGVSKTTAGTLGVATLTSVPQVAVSAQTLTSANNGLVFLQL